MYGYDFWQSITHHDFVYNSISLSSQEIRFQSFDIWLLTTYNNRRGKILPVSAVFNDTTPWTLACGFGKLQVVVGFGFHYLISPGWACFRLFDFFVLLCLVLAGGKFKYSLFIFCIKHLYISRNNVENCITFRSSKKILIDYNSRWSFVFPYFELMTRKCKIKSLIDRSSSCSQLDILKIFVILTRNHLCWSFFWIKLHGWRPATLLKRDSNKSISIGILPNFYENLFM